MAGNQTAASTWLEVAASGGQSRTDTRHDSIVLVQWALAIACAYLVIFAEGSAGALGLGGLVIVAFLAFNLIVGRLTAESLSKPQVNIGIAAGDTLLVTLSLYAANQLSLELVLLCLGILVLAIAGLKISTIAVATLAMTAIYLFVVWYSSSESLLRSGTLLRVPFLFTAAIVYAWLVEVGQHGVGANKRVPARGPGGGNLSAEVSAQLDAVRRCQAAVSEGSKAAAESALVEVTARAKAIQAGLARAAA